MMPGIQLLTMWGKYGKLLAKDITPAIVGEFASALGTSPSATAIEAATSFIREGGEAAIGALFKKPDFIAGLQERLVGAPDNEEILGRCPHCHNLIAFSAKTLQ